MEESVDTNNPHQQVKQGIIDEFSPLINKLTDQLLKTKETQISLRQNIDTIAEDLRKISELYVCPHDFELQVKKLRDCRKRLAAVSTLIQNIQERLYKLHYSIEKAKP